ncbi:MAG: bifunctional [glutamate--ammonia ligase]-adenylyl-L-tyrosine phosphorylase/[glutamate--ammonia-ligase] adenylyltransferase [Pseudomonadota bacterium]|nr:bifunctional [glutamate--ammonia ligase]-adenylyl-L-tyrosine phosphorylase/[glutamate--ammonia-ligase] adenylyltransferase [Pseudomonadota bacterium]
MISEDIAQSIATLPLSLREEVERFWEAFIDHDGGVPAPLRGRERQITRLWACSPALAAFSIAHPECLIEFLDSPWSGSRAPSEADLAQELATALAECTDIDALMAALRLFRKRQYLGISWRDAISGVPVEQTVESLSHVADVCICQSLSWLDERLQAQWGVPLDADGQAQSLIVLGMGKLGGFELNYSSDIDLIFVYADAGETNGARPVDNERYFSRLAQQLIKVLAESTRDGFVFRVDTRLRPFGESGPLVMHFSALEEYYQRHGREWERYAMIKARPITGDVYAVERLRGILSPFVYRRYLDFGALDALREMKSLIVREVRRKGMAQNIKLGPGGIREVEFIAQVFQLIRGGQYAQLRQRRLLPVLNELAERGVLTSQTVDLLSDAYRFLRRTENCLQQVREAQTHDLPSSETERVRLAFAMGYSRWEEFDKDLADHRAVVSDEFGEIFGDHGSTDEQEQLAVELDMLWRGRLADDQAGQLLREHGFDDADRVQERLRALHHSVLYRSLSDRGRHRFDQLMPLLLLEASGSESPETALARLIHVVESIGRRSPYLSLLVENPMARSQLVRLCATSPWISDYLAAHPILLDELLDPRALYRPPDRAGLGRELAEMMAETSDLEQQMETLRHFHQINVLRVAAADIGGHLPVMRVSDHLTDLAEVILRQVLLLGWADLVQRYGRPRCLEAERARTAQFGIVAYGKLGGIELGYGSDLDLVFLHDSAGGQQETDGTRAVDNAVFFARLTQRLIHFISTPTPSGFLYDVDTRLRPSGRSGLLVSSIDGYADYQRRDAWTWEHQALVRARMVAGAPSLVSRFQAVRAEILSRRRDSESLRNDVRDMRARMRETLDQSKAGFWDIKQGAGGVADIEFMVQYGVLNWAHTHPAVLRYTDNIRILETFAAEGLMSAQACEHLADAYRHFRLRLHALNLEGRPAIVKDSEMSAERELVMTIWERIIASSS